MVYVTDEKKAANVSYETTRISDVNYGAEKSSRNPPVNWGRTPWKKCLDLLEKKVEPRIEEITESLPDICKNYTQLPKAEFVRTEISPGLTWQETWNELKKQGLRMPTINEFFDFYNFMKENAGKGTPVYDSKGNQLPAEKVQDAYHELTGKKGRIGIWLDNYYEKYGGQFCVLTNDKKERKVLEKSPIEEAYINLKFNEQGSPIEKAKLPSVRYFSPVFEGVTLYSADQDSASLFCGIAHDSNDPSMRVVYACRDSDSEAEKSEIGREAPRRMNVPLEMAM